MMYDKSGARIASNGVGTQIKITSCSRSTA
jgi:hypothetical protein